MTWGEPNKTRKLPNLYAFMQTGSNSEGNGPRWQTDPENPMLGLNGQLQDACERLQQFVYSPSEAPTNICIHDNTEDDLPTALQVDANITRPKQTIKQVTHRNPLEVLEQEKLAAKSKVTSTLKKKHSATNKHICQETVNAFAKFKILMDHLKLPQSPAEKDVTAGEPAEVESLASEAESIKEINVSRKHTRQHQKDTTAK